MLAERGAPTGAASEASAWRRLVDQTSGSWNQLTDFLCRLDRLRESGERKGVPADEVRDVVDAFEFVQLLRLRTQHRRSAAGPGAIAGNANRVTLEELSELDRRILKEALRQVRKLQQRLALDYPG